MQKKLISFSFGLLFIYPILALPSCSSSHNQALRNEISGRGPIDLDLTNPYLAPNKFLSEETKTSETLKGFLSLKGAPERLEFSDPLIGAAKLKLIYTSNNESYLLEESTNDWIISGPNKVNQPQEGQNLNANAPGSLIASHEKPVILNLDENNNNSLNPTSENMGLKNSLTEAKLPSSTASQNNSEDKTKSENLKPNFKDVYHQVSFQGQTISFLADWYTGSSLNATRLKRINSSLNENLKTGDILRIPSYLTQKDQSPTEDDLEKYLIKN